MALAPGELRKGQSEGIEWRVVLNKRRARTVCLAGAMVENEMPQYRPANRGVKRGELANLEGLALFQEFQHFTFSCVRVREGGVTEGEMVRSGICVVLG